MKGYRLLGIAIIIAILSIPSVLAFDFDNVKSFTPEGKYGKIEIINFFGLGSRLAEYNLLYNTDQCLIDCYATGTARLYSSGQLFQDMKFINGNNQLKQLRESKILITIPEEYQEEIIKNQCTSKFSKNGSAYESCEQIGTKEYLTKTRLIQKQYNGEVLSAGTYDWRIEGKKDINDRIDWIPTAFGKDLDEWAWWDTTFNKRLEINISGDTSYNNTLNWFPVFLNITYDSDMQVDFDDVRFVNGSCSGSQTVQLTHEFNDRINSSSARVWVLFPTLIAGFFNNSICMYYNNPSAANGENKVAVWGQSGANASAVYHFDEASGNSSLSSTGKFNLTNGSNSGVVWSNPRVASFGGAVLINNSYLRTYGEGVLFNSSQGFAVFTSFDSDNLAINKRIFDSDNSGNVYLTMDAAPSRPNMGFFADHQLATGQQMANGELVTWGVIYNISSAHFILNGTTGAGFSVADSTNRQFINNISVGATIAGAAQFQSNISELQIYNGTKTLDWMIRMHQNINYTSYLLSGEQSLVPIINLTAPANASTFLHPPVNINCTATAGQGTLVNVSFWSNGVINSSVTGLTGTQYNFSQTINFPFAQYNWTCGAYDSNGRVGFAPANFTFTTSPFTENNQNYTNNTFSLKNENFTINITYDNALYTTIAGYLVHNGTTYTGTKIGSGTNVLFRKQITMPKVSSLTQKQFHWEFVLSDGSTFAYYNSTFKNHTIAPIGIDDCSGNNITLLNYTIKDEDDQTFINYNVSNTTFQVDLKLGSPDGLFLDYVNYSASRNNTNSIRICVSDSALNGTGYALSSEVKYDSQTRAKEFHNLQNVTVTNNTVPLEITLYDLNSSRATKFLVTYKDINFLAVPDALIDVTRKYLAEGVFKSVEVPKTDDNGQAVVNLVTQTEIYTFIVKKNGQILATFDNIYATCQDATLQCTLNLNAFSTGTPATDFTSNKNLAYTLSVNNTARTITLTFTTLDGSSANVQLNATKFDALGNTSICSTNLISSSGTILCNVPTTFGNASVQTEIFSNGNFVGYNVFALEQSAKDIFGYTGIIMLAIMYSMLVLMFVSSSIGIVLGAIFGLVLGGLLNLYTGGHILGIGSTIIWFIIAGGILIWKITQRND